MTERRYTDAEVAAIFERASKVQQEALEHAPGEGMTLAQLKEIGREAGISPEAIAQAASLTASGRPMSRRFLGLPIGVGRTVDLERKLSDEEWERFVVDLRETFDARGRVRQEGQFKQWTNGNLQALLEPTATGHRIRLRTLKGDAQMALTVGMSMLGSATLLGLVGRLFPNTHVMGGIFVMLWLAGFVFLAVGAIPLPGWARRRSQQMEEIAARAAALSATPQTGEK